MWDTLSQTALELAASPWVLVVLLVCCWLDGFFPPVPSESVVVAATTLAVVGDGPAWWAVAAVAAAGAFFGDLTAFALGRRVPVWRIPLLRSGRGRATTLWAVRALSRRGGTAILVARYVPVGRVAVNVAAGALGYPVRRFVPYAALAAATWALTSVLLGLAAGVVLPDEPLLAAAVGVLVGGLVGLVVDQVARRRRSRAPEPEPEPDPEPDPVVEVGVRDARVRV